MRAHAQRQHRPAGPAPGRHSAQRSGSRDPSVAAPEPRSFPATAVSAPPVQRALSTEPPSTPSPLAAARGPTAISQIAASGFAGPAQQLPHLDRIQRCFGRYDVSGIKAHTGEAASGAAQSLGAQAYTQGERVAFSGTPSLHTAAHEAAHFLQQRTGVHLKAGIDTPGDAYERHADAVADRVVQGRSAESLLSQMPSGRAGSDGAVVQRKLGNGLVSGVDVVKHTEDGDLEHFKIESCNKKGRYTIRDTKDGTLIKNVSPAAAEWGTQKDKAESREYWQRQKGLGAIGKKTQKMLLGKDDWKGKKLDSDVNYILKERKLTPEEWAAVQVYTTSTYELVNKYLRHYASDEEIEKLEKWVEESAIKGVNDVDSYVKLVVSGMAKLEEFDETNVVSRGLNLEPTTYNKVGLIHKYKKGQYVVDPGFLSTSYGTPFAKDAVVLLELPQGHQGRDIAWLSKYENEKEVLFPPNATFEILDVYEKGTKQFEELYPKIVPKDDLTQVERFKVLTRIIKARMLAPKEQQQYAANQKKKLIKHVRAQSQQQLRLPRRLPSSVYLKNKINNAEFRRLNLI